MPLSNVFALLLLSVFAGETPPKDSASSPAPAATPASAVPTCIDVEESVDAIPSKGKTKVPTTIDSETGYRDMEAVRDINKKFKLEQVEKFVFDNAADLPSQARLLSEFKCFGSWKKQHDLYRKVLREHRCAYLRHRASQLLEYDLCTESTVTTLIQEFKKSIYQQTREYIIRKLGMSRDQRASALVDETIKSKSQVLSKAAKEGKSAGTAQPCMPQEPAGKPYYGYLDIGDICEGVSPEEGSGILVGGQPKQQQPDPAAAGSGQGASGSAEGSRDGGASDVHFGN